MIPPKLRAHVYATGLFITTVVGAWSVYKGAMELRKWTVAAPRLQHQEMEDFLRFKQEQAKQL